MISTYPYHLTIISAALVAVQCVILVYWGMLATSRARELLTTYFNPVNWLAGFYTLWFLLPQIVSLFPKHHLLGFEQLTAGERLEITVSAQLRIIAFLLIVVQGYIATLPFLEHARGAGRRPAARTWLDLDWLGGSYVITCFVVGIIAISLLGKELVASEGMRSQLVKTPTGKILTIAGFYGNFAFAFLFSRLVVGRRYVAAIAVLTIFATAVFLTGARGRLMWAMVIATIFITLYKDAIAVRRFAMLGVILFAFLLLADAGLKAVRTGDVHELFSSFDANGPFMQLFLKRNFDGFANFAFISHYDAVRHQPAILIEGGRDAFMNFYYPEVYASGVGFGVTYPGMFWLAGGFPAMLAMGFVFGGVIGLISLLLHQIEDERMIWAYLFAMTWFCAIGGNFQESFDKMCTAASPPLLWLALDLALRPVSRTEFRTAV